MPAEEKKAQGSDRQLIIPLVKNYLNFCTLALLVVEAVLGGLAATTDGTTQLVVICCMVFLILALAVLVAVYYWQTRMARGLSKSVEAFGKRIAGNWWETVKPAGTTVLSYITFQYDAALSTLNIWGYGFGKDGARVSTWESHATCVNPNDQKLFYYWTGHHDAEPQVKHEGYCEVSFPGSAEKFTSGAGVFSRQVMAGPAAGEQRSLVLKRTTNEEDAAMAGGSVDVLPEAVKKARLGG